MSHAIVGLLEIAHPIAKTIINVASSPPIPKAHDAMKDAVEEWSTGVTAVFTALLTISTAFLWWETRNMAQDAAKERTANELKSRQTTGYSLFFKTADVQNNLSGLLRHFSLIFDGKNDGQPRFTHLRPIAYEYELVKYTAEEKALVFSLHDDDLFASFVLVDIRHNALVLAWKKYTEEYADFFDSLPPGSIMDGQLAFSSGTHAMVRHKIDALEELLQNIYNSLRIYVADTEKVMEKLSTTMWNDLKVSMTVKLKPNIIMPEAELRHPR